ncbi:DUF6193 family natural product biosynthesis protein [Streptomyces bambusae]|uniref:Uncharacterized protein n=1 Tax=Streptomyces bambusae TaxID=1550616 RepID=A0ABS6ZBG6_9ACTN|nr:DUF6193 family natural product biosynthesis protein [Streptomyces bambusae]MBW5483995.1 hypothetical protein [Streptomyces bambusae]
MTSENGAGKPGAHDEGDAEVIAETWRYFLEDAEDLVDPAVVRAAYAQPRLRELCPGVSHGVMFFNQGTGYAGRRVGGEVRATPDGRYRVRGPVTAPTTIAVVDTLEEAFALLVTTLPETQER